MKRFISIIFVMTMFITLNSFALPNFWYSAVAYNSLGQVITTGPLAQVDVTITDGVNSASQTFLGVPVDAFGIFNIYVTGAGSINMVAGTKITILVNGVTVTGAPLSSIINYGYHFGDFIDLGSEVAGILPDANVADDLTINGGTINNTVIGATTPANGTFENLYVPNGETVLDNGTSTKPITLRANANGAQSNAIVATSSNTIDNGYATLFASKDAGGDGAVAWFEDTNQSGGGSVLYASNTLNPPSTSNHVAEFQSTGFADAALLVGNAFPGGTAIEANGNVITNGNLTTTGNLDVQGYIMNSVGANAVYINDYLQISNTISNPTLQNGGQIYVGDDFEVTGYSTLASVKISGALNDGTSNGTLNQIPLADGAGNWAWGNAAGNFAIVTDNKTITGDGTTGNPIQVNFTITTSNTPSWDLSLSNSNVFNYNGGGNVSLTISNPVTGRVIYVLNTSGTGKITLGGKDVNAGEARSYIYDGSNWLFIRGN